VWLAWALGYLGVAVPLSMPLSGLLFVAPLTAILAMAGGRLGEWASNLRRPSDLVPVLALLAASIVGGFVYALGPSAGPIVGTLMCAAGIHALNGSLPADVPPQRWGAQLPLSRRYRPPMTQAVLASLPHPSKALLLPLALAGWWATMSCLRASLDLHPMAIAGPVFVGTLMTMPASPVAQPYLPMTLAHRAVQRAVQSAIVMATGALLFVVLVPHAVGPNGGTLLATCGLLWVTGTAASAFLLLLTWRPVAQGACRVLWFLGGVALTLALLQHAVGMRSLASATAWHPDAIAIQRQAFHDAVVALWIPGALMCAAAACVPTVAWVRRVHP